MTSIESQNQRLETFLDTPIKTPETIDLTDEQKLEQSDKDVKQAIKELEEKWASIQVPEIKKTFKDATKILTDWWNTISVSIQNPENYVDWKPKPELQKQINQFWDWEATIRVLEFIFSFFSKMLWFNYESPYKKEEKSTNIESAKNPETSSHNETSALKPLEFEKNWEGEFIKEINWEKIKFKFSGNNNDSFTISELNKVRDNKTLKLIENSPIKIWSNIYYSHCWSSIQFERNWVISYNKSTKITNVLIATIQESSLFTNQEKQGLIDEISQTQSKIISKKDFNILEKIQSMIYKTSNLNNIKTTEKMLDKWKIIAKNLYWYSINDVLDESTLNNFAKNWNNYEWQNYLKKQYYISIMNACA